MLLAGDAAGLVNPMTGEGIYYAVATGILAGRAAAAALAAGGPGRGRRPHRGGRPRPCSTRTCGTPSPRRRLAGPPPCVDAGLRAAAADQRVFDDLVELGLARAGSPRPWPAGLARHLAGTAARRPPDHDPPQHDEETAACEILCVRGALPEHRYGQEEITDAFTDGSLARRVDEQLLRRIHANARVEWRHLALPL